MVRSERRFLGGGVDVPDGNIPQVTITDDARLNGTNTAAIYGAGFANWSITSGTFSGTEALGIKSGNWKISGGQFTATGPYHVPAKVNDIGEEPTGAGITGGTFTSEYQSAFFEGQNNRDGTALKKVAISGGAFTTNNTSLSAVTIHNSGNSTRESISLKDSASGNNLLYRGVKLTSSSANYNAKWGGDAENGYTLELKAAGSYKLMDAFTKTGTGIQITADGVTLDGNEKTVTSASGSATGEAIISLKTNETTVKNLKVDDSKRIRSDSSAISVFFLGENQKMYKDITLPNNEIHAGYSVGHRSTSIVVGANNVTLDGNTIHLGGSGQTDVSTKQRNESIGIRVWTYNAEGSNLKILNNTILKNESATNPQVGILFDAVKLGSAATIRNNTFSLGSAGATGAVLETMAEDQASPSLDLAFTDNTITSAGHWLYVARDKVDTAAKYNYDLTLKGDIYNNNFSAVTTAFFLNASDVTYNLTDSGLKWNTTPATIGTHKKIVTNQAHVAGIQQDSGRLHDSLLQNCRTAGCRPPSACGSRNCPKYLESNRKHPH